MFLDLFDPSFFKTLDLIGRIFALDSGYIYPKFGEVPPALPQGYVFALLGRMHVHTVHRPLQCAYRNMFSGPVRNYHLSEGTLKFLVIGGGSEMQFYLSWGRGLQKKTEIAVEKNGIFSQVYLYVYLCSKRDSTKV